MNKIRFIIYFSIFLFAGIACNDHTHHESGLERRIISLSPNITEIIYVLGAEKDLVAVSSFCKYPPEVQTRENIGGLLDPDMEKIVSLKPTLVLGTPAHQKLDRDLRHFNLRVTMLADETVADILQAIDTLGRILNCTDRAQKMINDLDSNLAIIRQQKAKQQHLSAMLVIGKEPGSLQNLMVAGPRTFLHELWTMTGGINVFADLTAPYSSVNLEAIIQRNPQVIIQFDPEKPGGIHAYAGNHETEWQSLKEVAAVKNGNIFTMGGDYVFIPGPRFVLLARDFVNLGEQVHQ